MPDKSTTAQLLSGPVQYIEETTEGTTPTSGSTTSISATTVSIKKDGQFVDISQLGPEDLIAIIQGASKPESQIKLNLLSSTFLKYLTNAANYATATGTISATLSIIIPIYLNNTVNYIVMKGSRPKSGSIALEVGKKHEVTIEFAHTSIAAPTSTAPSGLTLTTTFPSGAVWGWLDGGADPVSWNSVAQNCKKITININRNTTPDHTLGNYAPYGTQPHGRRISGDFVCLWTTNTLEADHDAGTARTLAVVLKSSTSTLTITSAKLVKHDKDFDDEDTESIVEMASFRSLSCSLT